MNCNQKIKVEKEIKLKLESIKEEKIDCPEIKAEPLDINEEPLDIKEEPLDIKSTVMRKSAKDFNISGWLFFSLIAKSKVPIQTSYLPH